MRLSYFSRRSFLKLDNICNRFHRLYKKNQNIGTSGLIFIFGGTSLFCIYKNLNAKNCIGNKYFKALCASNNNEKGEDKKIVNLLLNKDKEHKFNVEFVGAQGPFDNDELCKTLPVLSARAIQINANDPIEDRLIIQRMKLTLQNGKFREFVVAAVIDGHGGWQIAEYLQKKFLHVFQNELYDYIDQLWGNTNFSFEELNETDFIACLSLCLRRSYMILNDDIKRILEPVYNMGFSRLASIGACLTVSIVTDFGILTANSGDCLAVFCNKTGLWLPMNEQLSAMNPIEQKRLEKIHPNEIDDLIICKKIWKERYLLGLLSELKYKGCYVKGILQPSRAIGDFRLKDMDFNYNWDKDLSSSKLTSVFSYILKNLEDETKDENNILNQTSLSGTHEPTLDDCKVIPNNNSDSKEITNSCPYSYSLINGSNSIHMSRSDDRFYVKNPQSFPYVRTEPMLHLFMYNQELTKRLESTTNTQINKISNKNYELISNVQNNKTDHTLSINIIQPEYLNPPLSECNSTGEYIKEYALSKLKNIYPPTLSYIDSDNNNEKEKSSYLILGTDGLWDFLTPKDTMNIVTKSKDIQKSIENLIKEVFKKAGINSLKDLKNVKKKRKVFDDTSIILLKIDNSFLKFNKQATTN
ncbi:uncharacterized protein CMU_043130 [Cryptosporidium muris RN66]|uniref:PPM-type phosphatase domain-containing protein n=1 Tax=Cryptosporidium muris (strain RN66) TaxID=441375 RepID=B6AAJ8_CRYMR|nr:uncharacterized protein CMU_043130 [Cryptosporidium muris RN66]EEA05239.1 hypothetical protein, conserved [Cryptosporidium muris RN66]|eukprot:XP_002139588.1 hypothetical protein [Cryptosporidium muris RN66]